MSASGLWSNVGDYQGMSTITLSAAVQPRLLNVWEPIIGSIGGGGQLLGCCEMADVLDAVYIN